MNPKYDAKSDIHVDENAHAVRDFCSILNKNWTKQLISSVTIILVTLVLVD